MTDISERNRMNLVMNRLWHSGHSVRSIGRLVGLAKSTVHDRMWENA